MNYFTGIYDLNRHMYEERLLKHRLTVCALLCALSVALLYTLSLVFYFLVDTSDTTDAYGNFTQDYCISYLVFSILVSVVATALPFFIATHHLGGTEKLYPMERIKPSSCALFVLLGLGACMVFQWLGSIWSEILGSFGVSDYQYITYHDDIYTVILLFVATAAVPALMEEMVYRGVILNTLRPFGEGFAIIISALLFGMGHLSISSSPFAFMTGLALGFIAVKSGSLIPSVAVHFLNNAYALIYSIIYETGSTAAIFIAGYGVFALFILLGIIALGILAFRYKNLFKLSRGFESFSGRQKIFSVCSNGAMLFFTIIFLAFVTLAVLAS